MKNREINTRNRTDNSIRNSIVSLTTQSVGLVMSFISRTFFIYFLGVSYVGINGLFSNILSILSFAELGIGTAIVYAMYKPIADRDVRLISGYMNLYSKIYNILGLTIFFAGIMVLPFIGLFIKDIDEVSLSLINLKFIYLLYLTNVSISYFFTYKRTLIVASQLGYIDQLNQFVFNLLRHATQIIILVLTGDFILYLLAQILMTILSNLTISKKTDELFPFLNDNKDVVLTREEKTNIKRNIAAMASHKLGSVIVSGTDNILISRFVGLVATGVYSNYFLLSSSIKTLYTQIFMSISSSIGNHVVANTKDESYFLFGRLFFINSYISIFCTTCLVALSNPFIELLWGKEYLFSSNLVLLIMFSFYINSIRQATIVYIDTSGLFWYIKWKSIFEAIVNLLSSLFFLIYLDLGVSGVVLGTILSCLSTNFWWEPYVVFKYTFGRSTISYFRAYFKYLLVLLLSVFITLTVNRLFATNLLGFLYKMVTAILVPNFVIFILFRNSKDYRYLVSLIIYSYKHLSRKLRRQNND